MRPFCLCAALAAWLAGCGSKPVTVEEFGTRAITLPNGKEIRAEVMTTDVDMQRGMMFRAALAPGRGMLFIHPTPGNYTYYMYQVKIPLDIIFLDPSRRVVEIAPNVPPCQTKASECPTYGGHERAQFVLELGGGEAAKLGLKTGDLLTF